MGGVPWRGACLLTLLWGTPAFAQQGSVQLSAATQILSGDRGRVGGQDRREPDLGIVWFQPGFRFGTLDVESHVIQRNDRFLLGRTLVGLRDVKAAGLTWAVQGGDTSALPSISDYRFTNLFAPRVSFAGVAVQGASPRTSISANVGRATVLRNIFGTDTQVLDQDVALLQIRQQVADRVDLSVRGSRLRTRDLGPYQYYVDDSRETGAGVRYQTNTPLEIVADAAYASFRRRGVAHYESDVSALLGSLWSTSRGWLQVNLQRFSPGYFPSVNASLNDREGLFTAGEHDLTGRLRVFGGVDAYRTNLDPAASADAEVAMPRTTVVRGFGGVRARLSSRSLLTVRFEEGGREQQPVKLGSPFDTDAGSVGLEWQGSFGRWNTFARYQRRDNVERVAATGSYLQQEFGAQVFVNPTRGSQVYTLGTFTTRDERDGAGEDSWQVASGGSLQLFGRNLWMRGEATTGETLELQSDLLRSRQGFNVGLHGQIGANTSIALDVFADRMAVPGSGIDPWMTRSTVRLTHRIPTGSVRVPSGGGGIGHLPTRGTGRVAGFVYADWNVNGLRDAGEESLAAITIAIEPLARVQTGAEGQFVIAEVPAGLQRVGLDVGSLPVDYAIPLRSRIDVEVRPDRTETVSFGLIPLGSIGGRVYRDGDSDGRLGPGDEPIDDVVMSLDAGARSELARGGRYRFDAVPVGVHSLRLLADSLPSGAEVIGADTVSIDVNRDQLHADVPFLVRLESRPEIRTVFQPGATAARPRPGAPGRPSPSAAPATAPPARTAPETAPAMGTFVVQVAAMRRPERARALVNAVRSVGFDAWLLQPGPDRAGDLYRVGVGGFASRGRAQQAARTLSRALRLRPIVAAGAEAPFRIQAGAFADEGQARALVVRLADLGYEAYLLPPVTGGTGTLYRVRVGSFAGRSEADAAAAAIGQAVGFDVIVTQDQPGDADDRPHERRR